MTAFIETLHLDGSVRKKWDEAAGVVLMAPLPRPRRVWRHSIVSSPFVDGDFSTHSSLAGMSQPMTLELSASSTTALEVLMGDLLDDLELTHHLLLRITLDDGRSLTYRADRPDVEAPDETAETGLSREVHLTWRVQPHPTITGV